MKTETSFSNFPNPGRQLYQIRTIFAVQETHMAVTSHTGILPFLSKVLDAQTIPWLLIPKLIARESQNLQSTRPTLDESGKVREPAVV